MEGQWTYGQFGSLGEIMYKYKSKSKHMEDMEWHIGSIKGKWTYGRYGRTGGLMADIEGQVDIWKTWKYGLICELYILTGGNMDKMMI